jgi:hypothetical protein
MDLSIVIGDWPYEDRDESRNVRKVMGVDGTMKIQLRIRSGVIQWEIDGRPDGTKPHGFPSVLDYCIYVLAHPTSSGDGSEGSSPELGAELVSELAEELFDYYRRSRALFYLADYRRALSDALHNLKILKLIRECCVDEAIIFNYDRYRPSLVVDRARAEMLLHLHGGDTRKALDALNSGIRDVEAFCIEYELEDQWGDNPERQILVDLRRSLREKHNVPLNDEELLQSLKVEQEIAIRRENYEMAARLRDKINSLLQKIGAHK